jgi:hypothetical protein
MFLSSYTYSLSSRINNVGLFQSYWGIIGEIVGLLIVFLVQSYHDLGRYRLIESIDILVVTLQIAKC